MSGLPARADAYGNLARHSALADWLEVAALSGLRVSRADLQDIILDSNWGRKDFDLLIADEEYYESEQTPVAAEDKAREISISAFDVLRERSLSLGRLYPFDQASGFLRVAGSLNSHYLALLSIAVVHAWADYFDPCLDPEAVLEREVAASLEAHGYRVCDFGKIARGASSFGMALVESGKKLGFAVNSKPLGVSKYAQDGGVDTIATYPWRDGRPGRVMLLGQATCGSSQTWEGKMGEPKSRRWTNFLLEPTEAICFLAVPHHVMKTHLLALLHADSRCLVIDRLRLVGEGGLTAESRELVEAVLEVGVENPTGATRRVA